MLRKVALLLLVGLAVVFWLVTRLPGTKPAPVQSPKALITALPVNINKIPHFDHIVWIVLENKSYEEVVGDSQMPYLNSLAKDNVLLDHYYAISHPSLPNYIALIGGSTLGIKSDCSKCYVNGANLADRLEAASHTWKTYQEDMPSACYKGSHGSYAQRHNPFIYFDQIRQDAARCQRSVVPLAELNQDLANGSLPDFAFISPNLCHSGHDCGSAQVDAWLKQVIEPLRKSPALGNNYLIAITYDEGADRNTESCCDLGKVAGGRVATILISPQAKAGFTDPTPLSHYSLLKTVLLAWNLPALGATSDPLNLPITAPWK